MKTILIIFSIVSFVIPFVDLFLLSKKLNKFQEIASSINANYDRIKQLDESALKYLFNSLSPKEIRKHFEKSCADTTTVNYIMTSYKKVYNYFLWYFVIGFLLAFLNIIMLILYINYCTNDSLWFGITVSIMNIFILWIFKISPIIHYLGFNRFATAVDNIAFDVISPNGKLNDLIYRTVLKFTLYIVDLAIFAVLYKYSNMILKQHITINLFVIGLELILYQYFFGKLISFLFGKIYIKFTKAKRKYIWNNFYSYCYNVFKNTSYLVFLSIYVLNKYVQLASGDTSYNSSLIEAIGIVFLIDTYIEKNKFIDANKEDKNYKNDTNQNYNIQNGEENSMNNTSPEGNSVNIESQNNTSSFQLEDTAIPEYLEIMKNEYEIERNKKQSFESRSGLLLTLLSAICIFYFQNIKIADIINLFSQALTFILLLKIIVGCLVYFSFFFTFLAIIKTLRSKKHFNFEIKNINESLLAESRKDALARLIFTYRNIIVQHRSLNETRSNWYLASLYSTFVLLVSTLLYTSI